MVLHIFAHNFLNIQAIFDLQHFNMLWYGWKALNLSYSKLFLD